MRYPCDHCTRVAWPEGCDNKQCVVWRKWFTERWAGTRRLLAGFYGTHQ